MFVGFCLMFGGNLLASPSSGHLSGLILSEQGSPISDIVVSLLQDSRNESLPTLAKSNDVGRIHLRDLHAGTYQILIKSALYRSPVRRIVEILPDKTVVVTLILQQVFDLQGGGKENVSLKAILRNKENQRLVFRTAPDQPGDIPGDEAPKRHFDEAVFQIYSSAGQGSNYFVYPGDSSGGTTTNFAVLDKIGGKADHIFAGQLNSGENSIWRIHNFVDYELSERSSLRFLLGYGRMSYVQPSLSLLSNPGGLANDTEFTSAEGTSKILSAGIENNLGLTSWLSVTWGAQIDQLRNPTTEFFVSPKALVEISPDDVTDVQFAVVSSRPNLGNTLRLPDGRNVSLASPLFITNIDNQVDIGTERHYQLALRRALSPSMEIEGALFENNYSGSVSPIVAVFQMVPEKEVLRLGDARSRGARVTLRQDINQFLRVEASYIRGSAPGLAPEVSFDGIRETFPTTAVQQSLFHAISTQLNAQIPKSGTFVTALINFVPNQNPLVSVDPLSDVYEVGNAGVNLFVRQVLPVPQGFLAFLGLDFLAPEKVEALLDVRNLMNHHVGQLETAGGDVTLLNNPRSVRGGVSLKF
ncbi:MAG TPA: carboxypeptidase-like regulatory domain-containing protein [Acidobacteriota bacterium]|nr:carboxypeptidase-like regulatory domain-containing protein [Acidobacteriota bacterium]